MNSTGHRVATGHIPSVRAASWSCTCGAGQVLDYGHSVDPDLAMQIAEARARAHRTHTTIGNHR
jgi:hypothetical protein